MSKTLDGRLRDARDVLDLVHEALGRNPRSLPIDVEASIRRVIGYRDDIEHWLSMLEARAAALRLMDGLENKVDQDGCVPIWGVSVKYQHARFIGVAAYVTTNWALADRMTELVGRVLCTPNAGRDESKPVQLVSHFVDRDKITKTTAAAMFESVRQTFGWPIGLSYAIRNHFVHDGAHLASCDFFEGPTAASAFRISDAGWNKVEEQTEKYGVDRFCHRVEAGWPTTPRDDLRVVLTVCEREMDDALGVLLGSACRSLLAHVGFMVGED